MAAEGLPRRGFIGLTLASSAAGEGADLGLPVRSVAAHSSAALAGVEPGDRLTHIDRNAAAELGEVRLLLRELRAGDPLELRIVRAGRALELHTRVAAFPVERYRGARCVLDEVEAQGHALRALCVVPDGAGPFPVLYYLPGAHWASEEYPLTPEHPVPALLSALAARGIASLRVERSGVGDSQGPACTEVDHRGEVAGYRAGLELLERASWADRGRLLVYGHSLGAMHAPLIAQAADVRAIVTFGAGALPIVEGLCAAIRRHARLQLGEGPQVRARTALVEELIREVVVGGATPRELFARRPDLAQAAPSHFHGEHAYHRTVRFYHQLQRCDIEASWRRYRGSLLCLHGSRDYISSFDDARALAALVGERAEARQLSGVDHHMSAEPGDAPPRLAPVLRETVLAWASEQIR